MIEKSCWQGLDDFFTNLAKALHAECEEAVYPAVKRKSRKRRRVQSLQRSGAEENIRSRLGNATFLNHSFVETFFFVFRRFNTN